MIKPRSLHSERQMTQLSGRDDNRLIGVWIAGVGPDAPRGERRRRKAHLRQAGRRYKINT